MPGIEVVGPQQLSPDERAVVARLYVAAFRRKLRVPLGQHPAVFVAGHLAADRVLLAVDGEQVVGMAGLRYGGRGFFDPDPSAFRRQYGLLGPLRAAAWRSTQTSPREQQLLLDALAVREDARGTGVGTALLEAVEERARTCGKASVILEVVDTNPRAAALYRRQGYRAVHHVRRLAFRLGGFRSAELMLKDV